MAMMPFSTAQANTTAILDVVFVNTDRGSFSQEDIQAYLGYVDNAAQFWSIAPAVTVSTQYHARAYTTLDWIDLYKDIPTLYIVYTHGTALLSGTHGTASHQFMFAVTTSASPWPDATIAHEFGHLYFGLPDWYLDGECNQTDIMCNHVQAYLNGVIGCKSLAYLGSPCMSVSLPLIRH